MENTPLSPVLTGLKARGSNYQSFPAGATNPDARLYLFLWRILADSDCSDVITWISREEGIFEILDTKTFSLLWGKEKGCKTKMTYDSVSRSLRYYYTQNILHPVEKKRQFRFNGKLMKQLNELCSEIPRTSSS